MKRNSSIRMAVVADINQISAVRLAVKENILSNPQCITVADYEEYLTIRGKGWVCEVDNEIVAFAIADLQENNVWALFVLPAYEGKGIAKALHRTMLDWYFSHTKTLIWLSTGYHTRAEKFYKRNGWIEAGAYSENELKFIMDAKTWQQQSAG